ncbi:10284_t:CDS:2 [Funneliformis geosporum]|uniref:16162_t:CDS:1 n=1 Tax=Funneliformis geosporum TaxID=1117311 RepID=A0A9W4SIN6_9GLOM|nr:10284_t:CDS:2 [Funneliformis geosporum]CAI2170454.1 16162_t:CDS:2 [Funneliformis geosporum]
MGKPKRNRMQIDNEPTSSISKPANVDNDKSSLSSPENKSIGPHAVIATQLRTKQGADKLLHKIKNKQKILRTKAKKRQEKGIKRALIIREKVEVKIEKALDKLNKKRHLKSILE